MDLALVWECRSDGLPGETLGVGEPSPGKEAWSKRTQDTVALRRHRRPGGAPSSLDLVWKGPHDAIRASCPLSSEKSRCQQAFSGRGEQALLKVLWPQPLPSLWQAGIFLF